VNAVKVYFLIFKDLDLDLDSVNNISVIRNIYWATEKRNSSSSYLKLKIFIKLLKMGKITQNHQKWWSNISFIVLMILCDFSNDPHFRVNLIFWQYNEVLSEEESEKNTNKNRLSHKRSSCKWRNKIFH